MSSTTSSTITSVPTDAASIADLARRIGGKSVDEAQALISFEGRDHYVAFVAAWKAALSVTVTQVKAAKRERSLKGEDNQSIRTRAQGMREALRDEARDLFLLRAAGKAHARMSRDKLRAAA